MAAEVFRGRLRAVAARDVPAAAAVAESLRCNFNPRASMAGVLTAAQLRVVKSVPFLPGRLPAPRVEFSCLIPGEGVEPVRSGLYDRPRQFSPVPRGVPPSPEGPAPVEPPGPSPGPQPGPGPSPGPGPGPSPAPGPSPGPCECGGPMLRRGHPRVLNFHLAGQITGGAASTELRVSRLISRPFVIRSIRVLPAGSVTVGQFVDVLVSSDESVADVAAPTGVSVFDLVNGVAGLPVEDQDRGLPVVGEGYDIPLVYVVREQNRALKVQTRFAAPALGLPPLHVSISIEELDAAEESPEPRPQPGPLPGPEPLPGPGPAPGPGPGPGPVAMPPPEPAPPPRVPLPAAAQYVAEQVAGVYGSQTLIRPAPTWNPVCVRNLQVGLPCW